jgi:uncharacterized protein YbjQ (UPF0145 family)
MPPIYPAAESSPRTTGRADVIVVTTENCPGFRVIQVLGPAFGLTVRSRGLGGNIAAGLRSITGGEVSSYVKLLEDARRQALDRLVQTATAMGANAVVMMRYDSSEIGQTMSEIVAYGTAVVVEPVNPAMYQQQPAAAALPAAPAYPQPPG